MPRRLAEDNHDVRVLERTLRGEVQEDDGSLFDSDEDTDNVGIILPGPFATQQIQEPQLLSTINEFIEESELNNLRARHQQAGFSLETVLPYTETVNNDGPCESLIRIVAC
jgi:hypothetical protein